MASVQMPRLSDSMETGKILRWLKKEGDQVQKGEPLVEIESDKANIEVEAYATGKLSKAAEPKQNARSGTADEPKAQATKPEAHVAQADKAVAATAQAAADAGGEQYPHGGPDDRTEVGAAAQAALNVIRRPAEQENGERQRVSPVARRLAEEHGVDLRRVRGSGPGGRITKEDVEAAAQQKTQPQAAAAEPTRETRQPTARPTGEVEVIELSKLQTTVAMRLAQSAFSAPHFYVTSEIAMDDAVRLRQMFNEAVDKSEAISLNDLVVKAVATALTKFPEVNASWADGRIERKRDINIGIAVGLPDRLIVPVLRNADQKSLKDIASESKRLIERARTNKASAQDYVGNTFSISNLGMYDVDQFTAIINPPDSGILAIGSIEDKAVVKDGQVVPGKRMRVTLSVDHRVFYGVTAAQFLQEVKRLLQSPMALVL
ncbi:MAG: 2-oxo acid dehydrogenase subunit E2 [Chloroflexi bacterium]|nr:MAG: 2-oxo acid dehydrogenase subunit E2 [Chloroflexota bacterium]